MPANTLTSPLDPCSSSVDDEVKDQVRPYGHSDLIGVSLCRESKIQRLSEKGASRWRGILHNI